MAKKISDRREFLQLAKVYKAGGKDKIAGWYVSEKLDGTRCFWDGGLSRGLETRKVPWAGVTDPKTGQPKAKVKPIATGLWSRYGNPIIAPDWFLDRLPACPLDGELWAGRGNFGLCRSICGGDSPDERFKQIQFAIYSSPPINAVMASGEIKNKDFVARFDGPEFAKFISACIDTKLPNFLCVEDGATFENELMALRDLLSDNLSVFLHRQVKLPNDETLAREMVEVELEKALANGGEGLIIRNPEAVWTPRRVADLLKFKPFEDAEGIVTGFTSGRETDKGSKHLGKIGALILDYKGKRLELSGLTDAERQFKGKDLFDYACHHPGEDMPPHFQGVHFKVGQKVTFIYRELTDHGIPKEARYLRERDEE